MTKLTLLLLASLASCQPSNFKGSNPQRSAATPKPPLKPNGNSQDAKPGEVREEFRLDQKTSGVDMVWLIDTSGSMREETAQVQSNFANFSSSLASKTGTRFALIADQSAASSIGGGLGSSGDRLHIGVSVGSTNALAIAAAAVCPSGTSSSSGTSSIFMPSSSSSNVCGQSISQIEGGNNIGSASGRLAGFFRKEAKPVFVVVTDDNARGVTDANFLTLVRSHLSDQTPTIYAFRGQTSRTGCKVANPGVAYDNLANSTGGKVFDICESDWSPHFSSLESAVMELITSSFVLKSNVQKIVSVKINGRELTTDEYEISGQSLTIKKEAVNTESTQLEVIYKSK